MNYPLLIRFCCFSFSPHPPIHCLLGSCIMISWNYFNHNQIIIRIGNWCLFFSPAQWKSQFSKFVGALVHVYIRFICLYINISRYVYQATKIQAKKSKKSDWCDSLRCAHRHPPGHLLGKKGAPGFPGRCVIDFACGSILICLSKYLYSGYLCG